MNKTIFHVIGVLACCGTVLANLQVASVFTDDMVLQRSKTVPVWGTGSVGESVSVSFDGQVKATTVAGDGTWRVDLDSMSANASEQSLSIAGPSNTIMLDGLLIGDVWLASGQSNMKKTLGWNQDIQSFLDNANNDQIRFLNIPINIETDPQDSFNASWSVSSTATVNGLSAIAVIFSQRMQPEIGVPLGVIISAEGSTAAECWVSNETFAAPPFSATKAYWDTFLTNWEAEKTARLQDKLDAHLSSPSSPAAYDMDHPSTLKTYPTGCYNGMLHPLFPFSMKGIIWRQGEANWARAEQYGQLMPVLLDEWRTNFEQPDLPFIQAQLPEQRSAAAEPGDSYIAELRDAQYQLTQTETNVEMAVLIDAHEPTGNVHPKNKQLDGERLAALALAKVYNQAIPHQGPLYSGMQVVGNTIHLSYDHVYGGLMVGARESFTSLNVTNTPGVAISNFAIAGSDQVFHWATATIDGTNVVVESASVPNPVAVRYAWGDNPAGCNLYNDAGFPAAPFRTDSWTLTTLGVVEPSIVFFRYEDGVVLEVQTSGSGQVQRTPDTAGSYFESGAYGVYSTGTSVALDAVAESGWAFSAWSGDASGTASHIDVVVSSEKVVTASFESTATVLHHIIGTGQSLSIGQKGTPPQTTTQPYSNLMLSEIGQQGSNLVPLVEGYNYATSNVETISSALGNTLTALTPGNDYNSIVTRCGAGARSYNKLKKGGEYYAKSMNQIDLAQTAALAMDAVYNVSAVTVVHGEADRSRSLAEYSGYLLEWQADYDADAKAKTGQTNDVHMFFCQMSSCTKYSLTSSEIPAAQYGAAENSDMHTLVCPKYFLDYDDSDGVHLEATSYSHLGEYYGKAMKKVLVDGEEWVPLKPTDITLEGATITVDFHVPAPPLSIDTNLVIFKEDYGFEYVDDSGSVTITNVTLVDADTILLALDHVPTGSNPKLQYAFSGVADSHAGWNNPGSCRGNIRDNDATPSLYGNNLYNWLVQFDLAIPYSTGVVSPSNYPPTFISEPVVKANAIVDAAYSGTLANDASDPNDDAISFSQSPGGPAWLSVATDGALSGTPGFSDLGTNSWTVQVYDGSGGTNQATLQITVIEAGSSLQESFGPTDDSLVYKNSADANSGADDTMLVRSLGNKFERRGFLKFDLSSLAGTVTSAKLKLFSEGVNEEVFVRSVSNHSWSESTITWNNAPWASVSAETIGSGIATPGNWFEIDLTDSITTSGQYGFTLETVGGDNSYHITSKEGGANAPVLMVSMSIGSTNETPFEVSGIAVINSGSDIVLQWPGVSGETYTIVYTTNLLDGIWATNRSGIAGIEPLNTETVQVDTAQSFFRIEQED